MKIFGIGLNKTGTKTLGSCLEMLGYNHHSYDEDLTRDYIFGKMDRIWEAADRYESFEDWPWPLMYEELAQRYPDARFILTVRASPEIWLRSLARHATRVPPQEHVDRLIYGYNYPEVAANEYLAFYERHNREVLAKLGDRCLAICWENGDGLAELSRFLGRPVPGGSLPHENAGWEVGRKARLIHAIRKQYERVHFKLGTLAGRKATPFPRHYLRTRRGAAAPSP